MEPSLDLQGVYGMTSKYMGSFSGRIQKMPLSESE